jgi:hypothetical protein
MYGNVGGRGLYEAIEANTKAINNADANRAKDSRKLRDVFQKVLVQLRIIKVHHEEMRGDVVTEQDVEHER